MSKPNNVVQLNTRQARIERQIDQVLDDLESLPVPVKERVAALYTIMRIQVATNALNKGSKNDGAGSSVRKYQTAFRKDDAGRGKAVARSVARTLDLESDDDEPDAA